MATISEERNNRVDVLGRKYVFGPTQDHSFFLMSSEKGQKHI